MTIAESLDGTFKLKCPQSQYYTNNLTIKVMPVTQGSTSWMRHVVCDFGSKKLDATWGDT